jgi:hypothetical protein
MNKDQLEQRLKEVKAQKDQLLANLNACIGIENELNEWLKKLNEAENNKADVQLDSLESAN